MQTYIMIAVIITPSFPRNLQTFIFLCAVEKFYKVYLWQKKNEIIGSDSIYSYCSGSL